VDKRLWEKEKKKEGQVMFHKIDSGKEEDNTRATTIYTIYGRHDFEDDSGFPRLEEDKEESNDAYAKAVTVGARQKYYVKRGRYGRLYNPIGLYSEGQSGKQMRHAGRPEWTFQETGKEVFDKYLNFLKTKNAAWLNNAERGY
jgi:hypothetical protein